MITFARTDDEKTGYRDHHTYVLYGVEKSNFHHGHVVLSCVVLKINSSVAVVCIAPKELIRNGRKTKSAYIIHIQ